MDAISGNPWWYYLLFPMHIMWLFGTGSLIRFLTSTPMDALSWFLYAGLLFLLLLSMSGLSLGLMSLQVYEVEYLKRSGTDTEKKQAATILPIVRKQHQLCLTLLFCTAAAIQALRIHLNKIFSSSVGTVFSAAYFLLFVAVIRKRMLKRYGLAVGAKFVWLVRVLMMVCYPIAHPAAKIVEAFVDYRGPVLDRAQMKAFFEIHSKEAGLGGELTRLETRILTGALGLREKKAEEAMTPIESTFLLDVNAELDWKSAGKIFAKGYDIVPVYSGNPKNIIGVVKLKSIYKRLGPEADKKTAVASVSIRNIRRVPAGMSLLDILNVVEESNIQMAAVVRVKSNDPNSVSEGELLSQPQEESESSPIDKRFLESSTTQVIGFITFKDISQELFREPYRYNTYSPWETSMFNQEPEMHNMHLPQETSMSNQEPERHNTYLPREPSMLNSEPERHNTYIPNEPSMFNQDQTCHRSYFNKALMNEITIEFQPYVSHIHDVGGDGNCGFRAIGVSLGLGENSWRQIRSDLHQELLSHLEDYKKIFGDNDLYSIHHSLDFYGTPATREYWLIMPDTGFLIANKYGVVVQFLSKQGSSTCFPLWSGPENFPNHAFIVIALVYGVHYVNVDLVEGHPMPTVCPLARIHRSSYSTTWENMYSARLNAYIPPNRPRSDSDVERDDIPYY